jgi:hypothetical protein
MSQGRTGLNRVQPDMPLCVEYQTGSNCHVTLSFIISLVRAELQDLYRLRANHKESKNVVTFSSEAKKRI